VAEPTAPKQPAAPALPLAPAVAAQSLDDRAGGPGLSSDAVLGDAGAMASVVIGDTVEIKATLPSDNLYQLDIYAHDVEPRRLEPTRQIGKLGTLSAVSGTVVFPWKAIALGVPVFRLRLDISAGGKLAATRYATVVFLFDWIEISLADAAYVEHPAQEGTARAEVKVDNTNIPTVTVAKTRAAWADVTGFIEDAGQVVAGILFNDKGIGRAVLPHYPNKIYTVNIRHGGIVYADIKVGLSSFNFHPPMQSSARNTVLLSTRVRLSIWADPALFLVAVQQAPPKTEASKKDEPAKELAWVGGTEFTSAAIDAAGDKIAALDDFTMLNMLVLAPDLTEAEIKANTKRVAFSGTLGANFWSQVVTLCHKKRVQAIAGYGDIRFSGDLAGSRFLSWLDSPKRTTKEITDFADDIVAFLTGDIPWDGVDFDIEHLTITGKWSKIMRANVQIFFEYLGAQLAEHSMILSVAGTSFIDHTHVQTVWVPATGSATGLPVTLGHLSPNILYRPMAYDNDFLGERLRQLHRECVEFALSPVGPKGAGLHPSGYQLGIKVFKGTNNGSKGTLAPGGKPALQGYISDMPRELQRTCLTVLRPLRMGLIMFAWGLQKPGDHPNWDGLVRLDEILNSVNPAPIPNNADAKALDALIGAARFPHATLGQPLQGPLSQAALDRLNK
jgi:hypothetical protein